MTNKQSWGEEFDKWCKENEMVLRYKNVNEHNELIKDFISNLLASKSEQMERLKMTNKDQAWNMLCAKSMNDVGLDEGAMELFNAGISKAIEILKK